MTWTWISGWVAWGGSFTILVRSGTSGSVDLQRVPERRRPDAVVEGVGEILKWL
ncbi:hypothetical protein [Rubrobacter naiadicus]|uniref:hypothetical protein n=1 Tax=Rubrobacter naiadicus TaxID=1392641 RepID=UPI0023600CBF|nr:hypothetical protein [Rubrobacter naiadicus]